MRQVILDYETRSEADLKKIGGVEYSKHPTTEIMCIGYKVDHRPTEVWHKGALPSILLEAAEDPNVIWKAHNALFEQSITENVLRRDFEFPKLLPERWDCTAARAAACALPRNLEGAAIALNLPVKKNMEGRRLMLKYSKPRRIWLAWRQNFAPSVYGPSWMFGEPEKYFSDPIELDKIYEYCRTDVEVEYLLDKKLPHLIPIEREIWLLNQKMNLRGVQVDVKTARLILDLIASRTELLQDEVRRITDGVVGSINQRDKVLEWLEEQGCSLPNLNAKTVQETLEALSDSSDLKRVLQIRQTLSKSSTKKYSALLSRAGADGRVRDLALYHGASTGRESGTGLQLQNLPRGTIKDTTKCIDRVISTGDLEFIEALYGDPMNVFSSCIRGMITSSPRHQLYVADYNAIEARVLAWLSGDEPALAVFKRNQDPYIKMASGIFGVDREEIERLVKLEDAYGLFMRQLGKTAELGCGYQMGALKFYSTCLNWGIKDMTPELAHKAVTAYRAAHPAVVKFWARMEKLAILAVQNPGRGYQANRVTWGYSENFLWVKLPSGRKLRYRDPQVRMEPTPWGELRPKLYHWGTNSMTKKWECFPTYGGLLVENITQATARDVTLNVAVKLQKKGYEYLFQVHDELVSESMTGNVKEYESILTTLPSWAKGLPLVAKGWSDKRYRK